MTRNTMQSNGRKTSWGGKRLLAFLLAFAMIVQPMFTAVGSVYAEGETTEAPAAEAPAAVEAPASADTQQPAAEPAQPAAPSEDVSSDTKSEEAQPSAPAEQKAEEPKATEPATEEKENSDAAEEETEEFPAQSFTGTVNDLIVNVSAPDGALPAETKMTVTAIDAASAAKAAERVLDGDVSKVKGANISFYNKEGAEIEPAKAVSVSMIVPGMDAEAKKSVVHIDDVGRASKVPAVVSASGNASFTAKDFSVYIVVDEDEQGDQDINAVATYEFYIDGELKSTQNIKTGDALLDPGTLGAGDGANTVFKGWYVSNGQEIEGETPGAKLSFGTKSSVPKTETIKVEAKVETTYYVTFLGEKINDERGITAVKSVTVEGVAGTPGTIDISDVTVVPKADTSAFKGWSESDGGEVISGNTITVTATGKQLYAVVVNAHWLHFYENVGEDSDSDATYTGPVFVAETDVRSSKKPADPTRKGYTFGGWYLDEECTQAFNWEETGLDKDTDLFAKWNPDEATFKVIVWKQKVTDAKDADDSAKTYDFEFSHDWTGTTGEAIDVEAATYDSYKDLDFTGFHYGRIEASPATVKADGTTVVNVYYDRNLLTIRFVDGTDLVYEEATDNNGTQYGKIGDEYIQLERHGYGGNVYWTYDVSHDYSGTTYRQAGDNTGTQYGFVNGEMVQLTFHATYYGGYWTYGNNVRYNGTRYKTPVNGNSGYGIVNGQIVGINRQSGQWVYTEEVRYNDTRYKTTTQPHVEEYTGLYGSTLSANGYTWPGERAWYQNPNSGGTRLTFLDAFKFEGLSGTSDNNKVLTQYGANLTGNNYIRFYKQNIDGSWPANNSPTDSIRSGGGTFTITEKYEGFKAVQYAHGGGWSSGGAGTSTSADDLQIRFERQKFTLTFMSEGDVVGTKEGVPYEDVLSGYKIDDPTKEHYNFVGWFEDPSGQKEFNWSSTMPAANKVVYAKWEPKQYHVSLDPDGGEFQNAQVGEFNVPLDTILDKTSLTQNVVKAKHELVGWFDKTTGEAYGYGKIEEDVNLIAKWRYPGQVSVVYDGGEGLDDGGEVPVDNYKYATDSAVVLGAPPTKIKEGYSFVGWKVGDTVYYTNNTFDITDDIIENYDEETKVGTVTVTAVYNKSDEGPFQKTHINWYKNDGSGAFREDGKDEDLLVNQPVEIPAKPDAPEDGAEFLGWARVKEEVDEETGEIIEPDHTQELTADDLFIYYNEGKYYSDAAFTKEVTTNKVAGDEDRVYHAMFAVWCYKYEVTFKVVNGEWNNGGSNAKTVTLIGYKKALHLKADDIPAVGNKPAEGYEAGSWDVEPSTSIDITENKTFTYTYKEQTVTIKYEATTGGSVDPASETVALTGDAAGSTATPAEGYKFVNWTKGSEVVSTAATFKPEKVDGKNVAATYTANFQEEEVTINYVSADTTMGSVAPASETVALTGDTAGSTATPAEGYEFVNWTKGSEVVSTAATFKPEKVDGKNVAATYTANFKEQTPEKATITYKLGGGNYDGNTDDVEETHDIGDVITIRNAPTREGYTFMYWDGSKLYPGDKYTVEGNHTFTAVWVPNIIPPTPDPDPTPTPTPTITPVTPTTPIVTPALTPAAVITETPTPQATIEEEPTPQATIEEKAAPKAAPEDFWALINLLCAIATCVISALMLVFYFIKRKADNDDKEEENSNTRASFMEDDDENEAKRKNKLITRLLGLVPAIGSVILFILTEDMSLPMQMVDKWTIVMVIILAIEALLAVFSKKTTDDGDKEEQGEPARA